MLGHDRLLRCCIFHYSVECDPPQYYRIRRVYIGHYRDNRIDGRQRESHRSRRITIIALVGFT